MITFTLLEMGYSSANDYNTTFNHLLVDRYLGVELVKEHQDGRNVMDVDSGPVVFGYGASATIMNIKTQAALGNQKSRNTWALMNVLGLPINFLGRKFYLFGAEPMFDVFMLWGCVEMM